MGLGPAFGAAGEEPPSDISGTGLGTWVISARTQITISPAQKPTSAKRKAGLASHTGAGQGTAGAILWEQNSALPSAQRKWLFLAQG